VTSSLVVELCGLPGSGKTTVARHALAALTGRGLFATVADRPISAAVPCTSRMARRTASSARMALSRPRWALGTGLDIVAVPQPSRRDTASALAQWLSICELTERAHRTPGVVHLLEEGLLQTLWTLRLRSRTLPPPRLLASLPHTSRSDLVVVIDVPVAVAEGRLTRRASRHSRSQALPADLLRAELEHGRALLEELAAAERAPLLRLHSDDTTDASALGTNLAELIVRRAPHLAR